MANQTGVAVTIADMAGAAQHAAKFIKGSLTVMEQKYELSDLLPFINLGGQLSASVPRPNPDAIGTVYYRNLNGKYTWTKSSLETFTEPTEELTYSFKIDTRTQNNPAYTVIKPAQFHLSTLGEQFAHELIDAMINGDPTVNYGNDPDGNATRRPPGIKFRLDNTLNGIDAGLLIDSKTYVDGTNPIDLTNIGSTVANNFVDSINETASLIGGADIMVMNYRMATLLTRAMRQGGMFQTTRDSYNRNITTWGPGGPRVIIVDLKTVSRTLRNSTDTSNWVLPYETTAGVAAPGAAVGSRFGSIYFIRTSATDGFTGLTVSGMQQRGPEKLPLPDEAVSYAMAYGYGFATMGVRCLARIKNIKIG